MNKYNQLLKTCLPRVNWELRREAISEKLTAYALKKQAMARRKTAKQLEKLGVL